ncbi:Tat pathway signal sequence domain protein [Kitasatospora sp. NPDC059646]|uniref:Tat pathway signal sequence domain protein n=1 Tax=Kitasatospora sp. NPDC059646 TaxID=3346893 RepID=UPI0036D1DDB3
MRNRLFAGAAALAAATALVALQAGPAGATVSGPLLYTDIGAPVNVGDPLSADLVSGTVATMYSTPTGTTGVKCTASHIGGSVAANPSVSPTVSGTASGPVTTLTFSGCTSNVVGVTGVSSLTMDNLPYTLSISDTAGFPVTLAPAAGSVIQATAVLKTLAGTATCTFRSSAATLNGNATNTPPQISLVNQTLTKASGPSICFPTVYFSAAYGPVKDTANGGTVLVN